MFQLESHTGGFTVTNCFLLKSENAAVLIDAPVGAADWLQQLQVRVDALLLTHQHFDHVMDAAAIREAHECPIYAFAAADQDLTVAELMRGFGLDVVVPEFEIDHVLGNENRIQVAGFEFELIHVPGHSPDSICFRPAMRSDRDQAILLGGDVLMQRSVGRHDFPHSDRQLLAEGIREKLYALPAETVVYPGHGPWTTIGEEMYENPFVRLDTRED
ncbi:MAG: MBL fold metallo-hydrolase [Verrucomicrobiota bacterium]